MQQCQNMQLGLRASLEKDTRALRGQPCRTAVLAFSGDAVGVTSLRRYVCKGKGLLLLTPSASSCICSQLRKKMSGLPAWAKVNHESVAEDSMPWVPEEVIFKVALVFPWSHLAEEKSHWKSRSAEQDSPIVNNEGFGGFGGFSPSLLWLDPLLGQVEVLNSLYLGLAYFHIFVLTHKSLKILYQVRTKHERLLE